MGYSINWNRPDEISEEVWPALRDDLERVVHRVQEGWGNEDPIELRGRKGERPEPEIDGDLFMFNGNSGEGLDGATFNFSRVLPEEWATLNKMTKTGRRPYGRAVASCLLMAAKHLGITEVVPRSDAPHWREDWPYAFRLIGEEMESPELINRFVGQAWEQWRPSPDLSGAHAASFIAGAWDTLGVEQLQYLEDPAIRAGTIKWLRPARFQQFAEDCPDTFVENLRREAWERQLSLAEGKSMPHHRSMLRALQAAPDAWEKVVQPEDLIVLGTATSRTNVLAVAAEHPEWLQQHSEALRSVFGQLLSQEEDDEVRQEILRWLGQDNAAPSLSQDQSPQLTE